MVSALLASLLFAGVDAGPRPHPVDASARPAAYTFTTGELLTDDSVEPAPPAEAPPGPPDRLRTPGGSLDLPVGAYSDCSGRAEVPREGAAIDTCLDGRLYFIGHNPGPFAGLLAMGVGSQITYYDGHGIAHAWRIVQTRTWSRWAGSPPLASADVVAQFQTCITLDGNWVEILDAVPI